MIDNETKHQRFYNHLDFRVRFYRDTKFIVNDGGPALGRQAIEQKQAKMGQKVEKE